MFKLYSIPRINALGHKGPQKSSEKILEGKNFERLDVENEDIESDEKKIFDFVNDKLDGKSLFVGGDHSMTYPIGKAFLEKYGKENSYLIIFDAHADLMPSSKEPTHEEVFNGLINLGWKAENIVFVGLRKIEPEEKMIIEKRNIKYFDSKFGVEEISEYLKSVTKGKNIYVTIDIDCIDSSLAPGVNYPEKEGLSEKSFFEILDFIKNNLDVKVYDLVEVVLEKDENEKTLNLAKEIVEKIIQ